MRVSKFLIAITTLITTAIFTINFVTKDESNECQDCEAQVLQATENSTSPEATVAKGAQTNESIVKQDLSQRSTTVTGPAKAINPIKSIDDNWCFSGRELSKRDAALAETHRQDWDVYLGKAQVLNPNSDHYYPDVVANNAFVAPYEETPLAELKSLAEQGDKWAMISYLQRGKEYKDIKNKTQMAKDLIVMGATNQAVNFIVLSRLIIAKTHFEKTQDLAKTKDLVIEALAYVYLGLDNYDTGGLVALTGVMGGESFKEALPPELLLSDIDNRVKAEYTKLRSWVDQQRELQGIETATPEKGAMVAFESGLNYVKGSSSWIYERMESIDLPSTSRMASTYCMEQYAKMKY